ncbi:MAG TPA: PIN domain-containing protein [Chthoniobacterales bacterium]
MSYLVDANVLSEATKPSPDTKVVEWLRDNEREIVIDPVLPGVQRRRRLQRWFELGVKRIHCLPWEPACGLRWAKLLADLRAAGHAMPITDSLIAATALVHGITVATRNVRDFRKAGVKIVNPFA